MNTEIWLAIITPIIGLAGVGVGGWMAGQNDKKRRQLEFVDRQLKDFYGPLLALRRELEALGRVRVQLHDAAEAAWKENSADALRGGLDNMDEHERNRLPDFQAITEFDNKQLEERSMPMYRQMLAIFRENISLAVPDTLVFYSELVGFVEIWERHLAKSIPYEVFPALGHTEAKLHPFYDHVAAVHAGLRAERAEG